MNINEMKNKKIKENQNFSFLIIFSKKHNTKEKFFHLMNINEIFTYQLRHRQFIDLPHCGRLW